jgi:hypothetical protein
MQRHFETLLLKARQCYVELLTEDVLEHTFRVHSSSFSTYEIKVYPTTVFPVALCTCKWSSFHPGEYCSHALAAYITYTELANPGYKVTKLWDDLACAKKQKARLRALPNLIYATLRKA